MPTNYSPTALLETHFGTLPDPRAAHSIDHKLIDIIVTAFFSYMKTRISHRTRGLSPLPVIHKPEKCCITICGTICGGDDWEAIAEYSRTKQDWLKTFLELPNGIPSPDTFSRLFTRLKPEELQKSFIGWMEAVHQVTEGELVNIDGKTLRGAKEAGNSRSLIHMVSVWSASQHLVLGQKKSAKNQTK